MRTFRILTFCMAFLLSHISPLSAQKPAYTTGKHVPPPEARKKKNWYSNLYASSESEFFVADRAKGGAAITVYDAVTLKSTGTFTVNNPDIDGHDANWFVRYFNGEEITTIYSYYDKKADKNTVYGNVTNREKKEIVKDKALASINASKKKDIGSMGVIASQDKSKFLIYREPTSKKSPQETIELWLYDQQLDKMYKKKLTFPYKNKQFVVQSLLVTNSGKVVIIAYYSASKNESSSSFKVFGVNEESEELDEIKITPKGKSLSSASALVLDSGNSVAFTGFYRTDKKNKGANGIYYVKINTKTWEDEVTKFNKISEEDLNKIFVGNATSAKVKRRAKKAVDKGYGLFNFVLKNIFYDADGNIRIVTQVEYVTEVCRTDPKTGATTCTYYYHSNQIAEFDLNPDGEIVKSIVIPKAQVVGGGATGFIGHIALVSPSKIYYIFNDNDKNFNKRKLEKHGGNNFYYGYGGGKKTRLVYTYYSPKKGKAVKVPMTESYKKNINILSGADHLRMADGSVIVWGTIRRGKSLLLMRFYLKDKE